VAFSSGSGQNQLGKKAEKNVKITFFMPIHCFNQTFTILL
jgi:hypothetical protein